MSQIKIPSFLFLIASTLLLWGSFIQAEPSKAKSCEHDKSTFRCVKYLKNYDGDTATFDIPGVHPLLGEKASVRIRGIDTPEKNGKKPCEKDQARVAQRLVENLLKNAQSIELRNVERDKYFRILAEIWVDEKSIGDLLIKNKVAYVYDGGRKPADTNWCPTPLSR